MIIDLGKMSEYRLKIGDFTQTGTVDPQFHVKGVPRHQPYFFSEN